MPFLSPAKLLVVLVVAVVVLGPEKLPKAAKQIGSLWGDLRRLRERLESDVRTTVPGLPSTQRIHQAVHAPLSFLDELAGTGTGTVTVTGTGTGTGIDAGTASVVDAGTAGSVAVPPAAIADTVPATAPGSAPAAGTGPPGAVHRVRDDVPSELDAPSLN